MTDDFDAEKLTAHMLETLGENHNALHMGIELGAALAKGTGIDHPPPFCVVLGMPNGMLTRFTNMDTEKSLVMLAEVLRMAAEDSPVLNIPVTATRQ